LLITVPRTILEKVGVFQGVKAHDPVFLPFLESVNQVIIPRNLAEEDESLKQLVVYFTVQQDGKYLSYWRSPKGGDTRLHGQYSFGFGGHVNDEDTSPLGAVIRELQEEIDGEVKSISFEGWINGDKTPIERVHLGMYFKVVLFSRKGTNDANIEKVELVNLSTLRDRYDEMETWSQYVFDFINESRVRYRWENDQIVKVR
jgi:predicted NUDIX family phosphoesterase